MEIRPLAVSLSSAAVGLLHDLGLLETCRDIAERALAAIALGAAGKPREEMQLQAVLGAALVYVRGPGEAARHAWGRALEIATEVSDRDYQAQSPLGAVERWHLWRHT